MNLYLSSYKLGDDSEKLRPLIPFGKIGYIPSALDFSGVNIYKRNELIQSDISLLSELGIDVEIVELKDYFEKNKDLEVKLKELGAIFLSGGNVFVLRQALQLSGCDTILSDLRENKDFLYAGYSAAGCVLAPSLRPYQIIDKLDTPYDELDEIIWDGLGFVDYAFMPHFESGHSESSDITKEIAYCEKNNVAYKAIQDGDVIIEEIK